MVLVGTQGRKRLTGLERWERRVSKHFTALGPAQQTDRGQGTEVKRRAGTQEKALCVQAGCRQGWGTGQGGGYLPRCLSSSLAPHRGAPLLTAHSS